MSDPRFPSAKLGPPLVRIHTLVSNSAIETVDDNGDNTVELPKLKELLATEPLLFEDGFAKGHTPKSHGVGRN